MNMESGQFRGGTERRLKRSFFFSPPMFKNIKIGPSDLCLVEHIVQSKSLGRLRPVVGMLCSQSLSTDVLKKMGS